MKAVGDFIIVEDGEVYQKNELGLIISDKSDLNVRYIIGKVITIGELVKEVKEGMVVYFDKVAGSDIRIKGEKYKAIRERDVVVMLDDANTPI
jgi:chaperonin GroES|tara:strand:- start:552 stop:830 length:279 start_codon:yes stop_codon:yes gene_type:complete